MRCSAIDAFILAGDATLHGWLFRAKEPRGVVVLCHGNTENAAPFGPWGAALVEQGFDAFLVSYRGFGASSGVSP